jgi:hypothetical protein
MIRKTREVGEITPAFANALKATPLKGYAIRLHPTTQAIFSKMRGIGLDFSLVAVTAALTVRLLKGVLGPT